MVPVIIIAVSILVVAGIAYGAWSRRRVYQSVDELDKRKNNVINEPIADEISRVKGLTISGETEENFERWRKAWDSIVEDRFQEIELDLFDIEEAANKYQFKKAKEKIEKVSVTLTSVENEIVSIREEVDELVSSEQQNRDEIEAVSEKLKDTRAMLSRQQKSMGESVEAIREEVEYCRSELDNYYEDTALGNYMSARSRLLTISETIERLDQLMNKIPGMLMEVSVSLPEEIRNLRSGIEELSEQGFNFDHFTIEADLRELTTSLPKIKEAVDRLQVEYGEEQIERSKEQIEEMYQTLEQEVEAKQRVEHGVKQLGEKYEAVRTKLEHLEKERQKVKESYQLPEEETNLYEQMKKELKDAEKDQQVFADLHANRRQSYIDLEQTMVKLQDKLQTVKEDIDASMERLDELRSEELSAYEQLTTLRRRMKSIQMKVHKSHIPAMPEHLLSQLDDAEKELEKARAQLDVAPLQMKAVKEAIELGQHQVGKAAHTVDDTLARSAWAERLIQFGNRYRNEHPRLRQVLEESEWQFRNGYYDDAVEKLTDALTEAVPVALGNLESSWNESEENVYQNA
ncbi:septation ring formation regulator EzrA [Geomicrobium sp. JCM 19039]|uniref:septation ring formation regulator EzrA n=1 Tax=Geomicrobium sp. JCM 19039 TaxID=1460636 RepID=UPI00045F2FD1|nr:septation ring formation regulator EzrA [Geomicrobium sp. JCM 19039]GAK12942.1 septation ring formation regulator EzrA [Geomicrobium sp. JCM 19039]